MIHHDQTLTITVRFKGQFGTPLYDTGAFIAFMMGTISSIIDSIGDYYACAKVCHAPPPPNHAVNRGMWIPLSRILYNKRCMQKNSILYLLQSVHIHQSSYELYY